MKLEITTEILINASPAKVWNILTTFEKYPEWNPFIKSISGEIGVGKKITVNMEPPDSKAMTFTPKLLVLQENKELRWLGNVLIPGLFDGEHKFELTDNGNSTTLFQQSEKFNGILVSFFRKMLEDNTVRGFKLMNEKLKEMAEKL